MKKLIVMMAAASGFSGAHAQDDRNMQVMKSLYAKFEDVLGVNDYQAARHANMLIMAVPGQQLDATGVAVLASRPRRRSRAVDDVGSGSVSSGGVSSGILTALRHLPRNALLIVRRSRPVGERS